jgi:hypothetical protein
MFTASDCKRNCQQEVRNVALPTQHNLILFMRLLHSGTTMSGERKAEIGMQNASVTHIRPHPSLMSLIYIYIYIVRRMRTVRLKCIIHDTEL